MKHFLKIEGEINVAPLAAQLDAHPELWDQFTIRKTIEGTPHSGMSDIWVRYNRFDRLDFANPGAFNQEHVPIWYPAWDVLTELQPLVRNLADQVDCDMIGGVLITRIPAGEGIGAHRDSGWHVDEFDKFYLSVKSEPGAYFVCEVDGEAEALEPKPGEIWRFDNRKLHWVENRSKSDRITVIMCLRTDVFEKHHEV